MADEYSHGAVRLELDSMDEKLAKAPAACIEYMTPWTPTALSAWQRLTEIVGRGSTDSISPTAMYDLTTVARWNGRMSACQFGPGVPRGVRRGKRGG